MHHSRVRSQIMLVLLVVIVALPRTVLAAPNVPAGSGSPSKMPSLNFGENKSKTRSAAATDLEQQMETALQSKNIDQAIECGRLLYEAAVKEGDANEVARRAMDYSKLLIAASDYTAARLPLENALRGLDSAPNGVTSKSLLINTLIEIGELSSFNGDYQTAKAFLTRAVTMAETFEGDEKQDLQAVANLRLAQSLDNSGCEARHSRPLYEKALAILEGNQNADPVEIIDCLNNLATQLQSDKKYDEAIAYLERSLKLCTATNGEKNPDTAVILNNLAMLYRDQQKLDQSRPLVEKALKILIDTTGPEHISVARLYDSLGDIKYLKGDTEGACQDFLKAARIINQHVFNELPAGQSLAEQEAFLSTTLPPELSLLISTCREGAALKSSYGIILNWKGLLVESLRQQKVLAGLAQDSATKTLIEKLDKLRADISGWYQMAGTLPYDDWKKNNDALTSEKESVERALAHQTNSNSDLMFNSLTLDAVISSLKPDEAFVDIFEYAPFGRVTSPHYAAIACAPGAPEVVRMLDLGSVREASLTIAHWRNEVFANHAAESQWKELKEALWDPIGKILPSQTKKVILCPDGELSRLPWQLLPADTASGALLTEVDSARQFCELRHTPYHGSDKSTLLIAGGIDFNANPYSDPGHVTHAAIVKLPSLPGTLAEIKSIESLAVRDDITVEELSGAEATKGAILSKLPKASYIHLATHGFFFDHNYVSAMKEINEEQTKGKRGVSVMPSFRRGQNTRLRSPLVESGIAVSGANLRDPKATTNLGYITAEELVGLNLDKCRMMTLSACETGRGQEVTGQGVLGLRSAIMSCGVRSILMSVWKVSDDSTTRLMNEFYNNLWIKHMSTAEALRQAQLSMKKDTNATLRLPVNWGAWVLVGEGW